MLQDVKDSKRITVNVHQLHAAAGAGASFNPPARSVLSNPLSAMASGLLHQLRTPPRVRSAPLTRVEAAGCRRVSAWDFGCRPRGAQTPDRWNDCQFNTAWQTIGDNLIKLLSQCHRKHECRRGKRRQLAGWRRGVWRRVPAGPLRARGGRAGGEGPGPRDEGPGPHRVAVRLRRFSL